MRPKRTTTFFPWNYLFHPLYNSLLYTPTILVSEVQCSGDLCRGGAKVIADPASLKVVTVMFAVNVLKISLSIEAAWLFDAGLVSTDIKWLFTMILKCLCRHISVLDYKLDQSLRNLKKWNSVVLSVSKDIVHLVTSFLCPHLRTHAAYNEFIWQSS